MKITLFVTLLFLSVFVNAQEFAVIVSTNVSQESSKTFAECIVENISSDTVLVRDVFDAYYPVFNKPIAPPALTCGVLLHLRLSPNQPPCFYTTRPVHEDHLSYEYPTFKWSAFESRSNSFIISKKWCRRILRRPYRVILPGSKLKIRFRIDSRLISKRNYTYLGDNEICDQQNHSLDTLKVTYSAGILLNETAYSIRQGIQKPCEVRYVYSPPILLGNTDVPLRSGRKR